MPIFKDDKSSVIATLVAWGEQQPQVRAMILTSSSAVPGAPADIFSDYDVILVLTDVHPFHASRDWLKAFGAVLALYRDPLTPRDENDTGGYVVQFESGLKIDFTLWPVAIMQKVATAPELPLEFDAGYQVLLDKDGLTRGLKPASYRAFIPQPPSEAAYREAIEVFFVDTTYVAKYLWRGDLVAAKHIMDTFLRQEQMMPILQWHFEQDHGWSLKPGLYGRRIQKHLRPDLYQELLDTYTGADPEENWSALFRVIDLMRKTAIEVGDRLGYPYPDEMDRKVMAYLNEVKNLNQSLV